MPVLGQSAIEYLMTYGWMLISVSVASGVAYTFLNQGACEIGVSQAPTDTVNIQQVAVTADDQLVMEMEASSVNTVEVTQVQLDDGSNNYYLNRTFELNDPEAVDIVNAERIDSCNNFEASVIYTEGSLDNQVKSLQIQAPAEITGEIVSLLDTGGGRVEALDVQSTVVPESTTVCMGASCPGNTQETEEYVNRSGDTMTGPLKTNSLQHECIGASCSIEVGDLDGYVSYENNTMDGTLTISNIKPVDRLCMGSTC